MSNELKKVDVKSLSLKRALLVVGEALSVAHRGVIPHAGRLVAFGNRGTDEVPAFRRWLQRNGYKVAGFLENEDSWVLAAIPPADMEDTRKALQALWDCSPDHLERKQMQVPIADLAVQLQLAMTGWTPGRSWFTAKEVRDGLFLPFLNIEQPPPRKRAVAKV